MANEIDLRIQNVFRGRFERIPQHNSSLIRLFLSSTTSGEFLNILSILYFSQYSLPFYSVLYNSNNCYLSKLNRQVSYITVIILN